MKKTVLIFLAVIFSIVNMTFCQSNISIVKNEILIPKSNENQIDGNLILNKQKGETMPDLNDKLQKAIEKLSSKFGLKTGDLAIVVIIAEQSLFLIQNKEILKPYKVSTSKYGIGNKSGSNKTPLGTHKIQAKIGDGAEIGTIFKGKKNTGKIAEISYSTEDTSDEDYVTTRVMPLEGLEKGINKGNGIDSFSRGIYIHGTQEEGLIGKPASHGCIRMKNLDVIELFDAVEVGCLVEIVE